MVSVLQRPQRKRHAGTLAHRYGRKFVAMGAMSLIVALGLALGLVSRTTGERSLMTPALLVCAGFVVGWAKIGST